jgi:cupin fold WbuC family metalloprotein
MKIIDERTISALLAKARSGSRRRMNFNLHPEGNDPTNRFINAGFHGSYIRPHRHRVGKWELLSILHGSVDVLIFTPDGKLDNRLTLRLQGMCVAEIPAGEWHTLVFHAPTAAILEVKPGPYEPGLDKEFAGWAPAEGEHAVESFVGWLESAKCGESWSGL